MDTKKLFKHIPWVILGIIGAFCLSVVALRRGEHVSALWIVVASGFCVPRRLPLLQPVHRAEGDEA
ncbi:carbon starvation protein CstA [Klebsiella aerogenes]|nr:carbon starvation protein CstA [Klebsiella aerogenes]